MSGTFEHILLHSYHYKISFWCFAGKEVQEFLTEQEMKEASLLSPEKFIGIIFKDSMSYHLRVPRQMIPESSSHLESKSKYIRYMCSFKKK